MSRFKSITLLAVLVGITSVTAVYGQEDLVYLNDFEKSSNGWETRGKTVSVKKTKQEAARGKQSLKISGRREIWQGTQLNVTTLLNAGRTYRFTAKVKLDTGEAADSIKMSLERGDDQYDSVAAVEASANEWKTFSGRFRPSGNDKYLLVYFEALRPNTSFYIDDFMIEKVPVAPDQEGVLLTTDFQDGTAQNWFMRGEGVEMFSAADGDEKSLMVNKRSEPWHGLAIDLTQYLYKGRKYSLSISARLVRGQKTDNLKMTMMQTSTDGKSKFTEVSSPAKIMDTKWDSFEGEFEVTTDDDKMILIVEAASSSTLFFIDNFELKIK